MVMILTVGITIAEIPGSIPLGVKMAKYDDDCSPAQALFDSKAKIKIKPIQIFNQPIIYAIRKIHLWQQVTQIIRLAGLYILGSLWVCWWDWLRLCN